MKAILKIVIEDTIKEDNTVIPVSAEVTTSVETEQAVSDIHKTFTPIVTSSVLDLIDLVVQKLSVCKDDVRDTFRKAKKEAEDKAKKEAEDKAKKEAEDKAKKKEAEEKAKKEKQ